MARSSGYIKGITIEIGGDVTKLSDALDATGRKSSVTASDLSQVEKELKRSAGDYELLVQKQKYAKEQADNLREKLEHLNRALNSGQVEKESRAYDYLRRQVISTTRSIEDMERAATEAGKAIESGAVDSANAYGALEKAFKSIGDGAGYAIGEDLLDAAKDLASAAVELSLAWEDADARIRAATGSASGYAESMGEVARSLYAEGWGDSVDQLAESVIKAREVLGELSEADMSAVTESALTWEQVFGSDVTESLRGVNVLMDKFGLSATEACDLMTAGMQRGLDYTDELGDNLSEYAGRWAEAGTSATEYFSMLQAGVDAGAHSLDKVGDYLNEFLTSLSDGRMEASIGRFSESTQAVWASYEAGGATARDVLDAVVGELRDCGSETEALALASDTWSSLGEDNALGVITALADVRNTYRDTAGAAAEAAQAMEESAAQTLESFKRQALTVIEPVATSVLEALTGLLEAVEPAVEAFNGLDDSTKKIVLSAVAVAAAFPKVSAALKSAPAQVASVRAAMAQAWATAKGLATGAQTAGASIKAMGTSAKASAAAMVGASTAAKGLRTALASTGVGLAFMAVGLLVDAVVSAIGDFNEQAEEAEERADDLATVAGGLADALDEVKEAGGSAASGLDEASSAMGWTADDAEELGERLESVGEASREALSATAQSIRDTADGIAQLDARAAQAQGFADAIGRLRDTEGLTEAQQRELSDAVAGFNAVTGASVSIVDAHNGVLDTTADRIGAICDAYVREAQVSYYAEKLADYYDQQADQIKVVTDATDALADSILAMWQTNYPSDAIDKTARAMGKTREELAQTAAAGRGACDSLTQAISDYANHGIRSMEDVSTIVEHETGTAWRAVEDAQAALDGTNGTISELNGRMQEAAGTAGETGESLDELTGKTDGATEAAEGATEAAEDAEKQAEDLRDSVEDLADETPGLTAALAAAGYSVDGFADRLGAAGLSVDAFKGAYESLGDVSNPLKAIEQETGVYTWQMAENLQTNIDTANRWAAGMGELYSRCTNEQELAFAQYVESMGSDNQEFLDYLLYDADVSFSDLASLYAQAQQAQADGAVGITQGYVDKALELGQYMYDEAGNIVDQSGAVIVAAAGETAGQVGGAMAQGIEEGATEAAASTEQVLGEATMNALMDLPAEMQARGEAAGGYLGLGIGSDVARAYVAEGVQSLVSQIAETLSGVNESMRTVGEGAGGSFAEGIAGCGETVRDAAASLRATAVDELASGVSWAYLSGLELGLNFARGIEMSLPTLSGVVLRAAALVASMLHFSEPSEGPLVGINDSGAEMVSNYAASMLSAVPALASASEEAARAALIEASWAESGQATGAGAADSAAPATAAASLDADGVYRAVRSAILATVGEDGIAVYVDGSRVSAALAPSMDVELGAIQTRRGR